MSESIFLKKINERKTKNIIILVGVSFFALQALYFITIFGIDYPQYQDLWFVPPEDWKLDTTSYMYQEFFAEQASHISIFPKSLILVSLFFDSLNFINLMFMGWIILIISLGIIYSLLKQTNEKLTWLIIPISAFLFSPLQHFILVMALGGFQWKLTLLGVVSVVYFLNRKKLNHKTFVSAVTMGIVSTFSLILGTLVWILPFVRWIKSKNNEKKWLFLWILCGSTVLTIYFTQLSSTEESINITNALNENGITYILTYLSMPFRLKFPFLNLTAGIATFSLLIGCIIYLRQNNKFQISKPWIQFVLMGIFSSMVHVTGRLGDVQLQSWLYGHTTYYAIIANLPQIALLVFLSLILLEIKSNSKPHKRKKLFLMLIYTIISVQIISLAPSYYLGWQFGEEFFQANSLKYSCTSPSPINQKYCQDEVYDKTLDVFGANYILEERLSFFSKNNFNPDYIFTHDQLVEEWNSIDQIESGLGKIETVNDKRITSEIKIEKPLVTISGWILDNKGKSLDSVYVLLDGQPFLKSEDFEIRNNIVSDSELVFDFESSWKVSFLSGYLDGCHDLKIGRIHTDKKIILDEEIQICKK